MRFPKEIRSDMDIDDAIVELGNIASSPRNRRLESLRDSIYGAHQNYEFEDVLDHLAEFFAELRRLGRAHEADEVAALKDTLYAGWFGSRAVVSNRGKRKNSDDQRRRIERQVAQGDIDAALRLVRELVRGGVISVNSLESFVSHEYWVDVVGRAHDDARKVEARLPASQHQGYTNYETFTISTTLENDQAFYEGWVYSTARKLWDSSSDEDRLERDGSYSFVAVTFGGMVERAIGGWAPEDSIKTFAPQNTKDLEPEIEVLGRPWPRDRRLLGSLFSHLLTISLDRVDWREIGAHWLHNVVPESEGYGDPRLAP